MTQVNFDSPPLVTQHPFDDYAGFPKGGVLSLSSGTNLTVPGGIVIIQNSWFESNTAHFDNGGVMNLAEFAKATVAGDGNVFVGNTCGEDGAVVAATTDSSVDIEGGTFSRNNAGRVS